MSPTEYIMSKIEQEWPDKGGSVAKNEHQFREMMDALPAAIYITDAEGRLTYFNPAAAEFSGRTPELGTDQWCISWKLFHPDGTPMPHDTCPMAVALKEGRSINGEVAVAERPDGKRIWFEAHPSPLRDDEGKVIGGINMLVDITGRAQAGKEKQLRRSEREFVDFFENATLGLHWVGPDGTILWANQAELDMMGYTHEEYVGRHIAEFYPDQDEIDDILRRLKAGEELHDYEARMRCKDGSIRHVSISSNVLWEDGEFIHTRCFTRDVTERKEARQALRERETQLKEDLGDFKLLQSISSQLIEEENTEVLYEKILDAAVAIMRSEYGSLQMLHPERGEGGELRLLAFRGFSPQAVEFWEWVSPASASVCGMALRAGERIIVPDVEQCESVAGTEDLEVFRQTGIHAVQTTPLISRNGQILGMISTHWSEPHEPSERNLRLLDILARQAADFIEQKQDKQALQANEKKYRTLFESMDEGYCIIELIFDEDENPVDYRFLEVNSAFEEQAGLEDAKGKRMRELAPDLEEHWFEIYGEVAKTGEPIRFERPSRALNRFLSLYAFPFGQPGSGKVAVLFNDITEQKEKERTDALLSAIVSDSDDAIVSKNLDSIIMSWNTGAERMFGYTAEEVIGQPIKMLIPEDRIDEEDRIMGKIQRGENIDHLETIRISKDGTPLDVSLTISPVRDAGGRIVGASKIARDITERKKAREERERLLREVETERERLVDIFQRAPSVMCIMRGPDHVFEEINDMYTRLVGNRDVIGKPVREAIPEIAGQGFIDILDMVYQTGNPYTGTDMRVELRANSDGDGDTKVHYFDFVYQPLRNAYGEVTGVFMQGVDLTGRKRAQQRLQQINETLEERVEERTAALLAYQDQLRSLAFELSKAEERERQRLATDLHDNLGQMLAIAKMKLDLLQLQKNQLPDRAASDVTELAELMDDAIKYTRELMSDLKPPPSLDKEGLTEGIGWVADKMKKHGLKVTVDDDGQPKPLTEEVRTTLRQCVRELLFNVVKHADVDKARIELSRKGDYVQVVVEDKGKGFSLKDEKPAPTEEGGFGLFNINERMDLLGGGLEVVSNPGEGTRMILQVPVEGREGLDAPALSEEESSKYEPGPSGESETKPKIKVLLVDDHKMMREGLRKLIEEEDDLTVIAEASDGKEGIKLARETSPDVIVMDVNMPGINGIEATREITGHAPDMRIIGLSLQEEESVARAMRNAGASAYLTKSEVFETLCATIRSEAATARE